MALSEGDHAAAGALFAESLEIRKMLGEKHAVATLLEYFARLAISEGQSERAARLWGAAEALRERIGTPLPEKEREEYAGRVAAARGLMGEASFAATWKKGRTLSMDEAVEAALAR